MKISSLFCLLLAGLSAAHADTLRLANEDRMGGYRGAEDTSIVAASPDSSYGGAQPIEAIVRRSLGPVDISATISGPGGTSRSVTVRASDYAGGERYGDVPGKYFGRFRATLPENWTDSVPSAPVTVVVVTNGSA